ncbi:MAG: hypothetical protein LBM96_08305 [Methanobrevibacter sp.]|nr:hypothetical protein [Candidatus Methanoflexus mossambicus]
MKNNKYNVILLLISLIACFALISSVSAINEVSVDADKNNSDIQKIIDDAESGDILYFLGSEYENISLNINKNLTFIGNNSTLKTNGEDNLITFSNADGSFFTGFNLYSSNPKTSNLLYVDGNASNYIFYNNSFYGGYIQLNLFNPSNSIIDSNKFENSSYKSIILGRDTDDSAYPYESLVNISIVNNYFNNHYDIMEIMVENIVIRNNIIENFGTYNNININTNLNNLNINRNNRTNSSIAIYLKMDWTGGVIYNNTIKNGDIAIKHNGQEHGFYDVYGNTFENLLGDINSNGAIVYDSDIANSYHDNIFNNLSIAISIANENSVIYLGKNSYNDVWKPIYLPGDSIDPSLKSAKLNITTEISKDTFKKNGQEHSTYIIKLSNLGDLDAKNINISLNGIINNFEIIYCFASIGNFNSLENYWQIDSLSGNKDAILTLIFSGLNEGNYNLSAVGLYDCGINTENLTVESNELNINVINNTNDYDNGFNNGFNSGFIAGNDIGHNQGFIDGNNTGYINGFNEGNTTGFNDGYMAGNESGYVDGFNSGNASGFNDGYVVGNVSGYINGFNDGNATGYDKGYTIGVTNGYDRGYNKGNSEGYSKGYDVGVKIGYDNAIEYLSHANIKVTQSKDRITSKTIIRSYTFKNTGGKTGSKTVSYNIPKSVLNTLRLIKVNNDKGITYKLNKKTGKLTLKVTNLARNVSKKITFTGYKK